MTDIANALKKTAIATAAAGTAIANLGRAFRETNRYFAEMSILFKGLERQRLSWWRRQLLRLWRKL